MTVDPWILVALVAGLVAVAAGGLGLWLGERTYRRKLESWVSVGSPVAQPATVEPPPPDAEDFARAAGRELIWSDETIERGITDMMALAKDQGRPLSREQAREQVLRLLNPDAMSEGV